MPRAAGDHARGPAGRVRPAAVLGRGARHAQLSAQRGGGCGHQHRGRDVPGAQPVPDAAAAGAGDAGRAGAERDGRAARRRRSGGHSGVGAGAGHPGHTGERGAGRGTRCPAGRSRAGGARPAARPVARAGARAGADLRADTGAAARPGCARGGAAVGVRGDAVARRRRHSARTGGGRTGGGAHGAQERPCPRRGAAHGALCTGGQAGAVFHPAAGAAGEPAQRAHRPGAHRTVHGISGDGRAARRCVLPDISRHRPVPEPPARARHRLAGGRGRRRAHGAGRGAAAAWAGARGRVCGRGERGGVSAGDPGAVFLSLPARGHGLSRARGLRNGPAAAAAGAERAERRARCCWALGAACRGCWPRARCPRGATGR